MKLSDAIEQMFYECKPIGVRCKLCGELLTYSAMNVADDPYGVKEHYKELHKEVDINQLIRDTGTGWNGFFVDHNFVEKLNEIKKYYDMNNKKKVGDNPYEGGTLYSVLRDRILEREKLPLNCTISNDNMVRELLHTDMEELVGLLVQHELNKANAKFPPFADDMHGWAVLKEEIEEADEELVNIKRWHDHIWIAIRGNRKLHSDYIRLIKTLAKKLMVEAAQVAAMADKYEAMLERNKKKEE